MNHFDHDPQNGGKKGTQGKAGKLNKFATVLLVHIGVLALIILHIVLFRIL